MAPHTSPPNKLQRLNELLRRDPQRAKTEILKPLEGDLEIVPRPSVTGERHGLIRFRGHPTKGGYDDDPGPGKRVRRARRHFTDQLGAGAIRLVLDEGKTATRVARGLDGLGGPLAAR